MHSEKERIHQDSDKIVIFIHGFMGSPTQFTGLMDLVCEQGFSVVSLLLPGHGKSGFEFARSTLKSWEEYLENQLRRFSSYEEVYLVGHSIGGLLAINATLKFNISGVVLISSPLKICFFKSAAITTRMKILLNRVDKETEQAYKKAHSVGKPFLISIPFWARVLYQPIKLMRKTTKNLPMVDAPALLFHSESDEIVSLKSSAIFDELLLNSDHEMIILKESWHAYFKQAEKEIIYTKISDFIS